MRWWSGPLCTNTFSCWIFIVLAHWYNSPRIYMSPHSDTLSRVQANQSLPFLHDAACLAEKPHISLVWSDQDSNLRCIALDASTLTVTPPTCLIALNVYDLLALNLLDVAVIRFNPAIGLCLSHDRIWISNIICHGIVYDQLVKKRCNCCFHIVIRRIVDYHC